MVLSGSRPKVTRPAGQELQVPGVQLSGHGLQLEVAQPFDLEIQLEADQVEVLPAVVLSSMM